jgi:small subunit ribosomal protein S20
VANIKSAKKRARQTIKRNAHNSTLRSTASTFIKRARKAISLGVKADAESAVKSAMSQIDKMVPKGIFRKNKAARLKSHLNASLKKLGA